MFRATLLALLLVCLAAPATAAAATLSGRVWQDTDADGRRDRGEPALTGARVEVQRSPRRGRAFARVARRTTDRTGRWTYTVTRRGRYRARVTLPGGASRLTGVRTLRRRSRPARLDLGVAVARPAPQPALPPPPATPPAQVPPALEPPPAPGVPADPPPVTLGDEVWRDADDDGVRDADEAGEPGVTVELWTGDRATRLASTTTGVDGRWTLTAPTGAVVRVRLLLPSGTRYARTGQGDDPRLDSDVLATGEHAGFTPPLAADATRTDVDAGVVTPGTVAVGGRAWRDGDVDGIRAGGESGVGAGLRVELYNDSRTQLLAETVTTAGSEYALLAPRGGTYRVRFVAPGSYAFTRRDVGGNDTVDSDADEDGFTASISAAASVSSVDAGLYIPVRIGNFVWRDTDADGVQDAGEPGVVGVTVQLWNGAKTALLDSVTTGSNGAYTVLAPGSGDYRVRVLLPPGFGSFSPKETGTDNLRDSDVNPSGINAGFTDVISIAPYVISTVTWDAGLVAPGLSP